MEIKYNELLDQARKLSSEDLIKSEYKTNLAMIARNIDIASKAQAWSLKSFIHLKSKNVDQLLSYGKKALKVIDGGKNSDVDSSTWFCLVKILYRCGMILQESKNLYTAAFCMYKAKNVFEEMDITNEQESFNTLESNFASLLKEISQEVILINFSYLELKENSKIEMR
jgi:hypothetical protein